MKPYNQQKWGEMGLQQKKSSNYLTWQTPNHIDTKITISEEEFARKMLLDAGYICNGKELAKAFDGYSALVLSKSVWFTDKGISVLSDSLVKAVTKAQFKTVINKENNAKKIGGKKDNNDVTPVDVIKSAAILAIGGDEFFSDLKHDQVITLGKYIYLLLQQKKYIMPLAERIKPHLRIQ